MEDRQPIEERVEQLEKRQDEILSIFHDWEVYLSDDTATTPQSPPSGGSNPSAQSSGGATLADVVDALDDINDTLSDIENKM